MYLEAELAGHPRSKSPHRGRVLITPKIFAQALKDETGRVPPAFLERIFSRNPHKGDAELQAMETFGDRVLDTIVNRETLVRNPSIEPFLLEYVVRNKTNNPALAYHARRLGLDLITGDGDKALADRVEMLIGFGFQHGGVNTVTRLLSFDTDRRLLLSEKELVYLQQLWDQRNKDSELFRFVRYGEIVSSERQAYQRCLASRAHSKAHPESVIVLGNKIIDLALLRMLRDKSLYRIPAVLGKAREVVDYIRRRGLQHPDLKLEAHRRGKRVSVFDTSLAQEIGYEALRGRHIEEYRDLIADKNLRSDVEHLAERVFGKTPHRLTGAVHTKICVSNLFPAAVKCPTRLRVYRPSAARFITPDARIK